MIKKTSLSNEPHSQSQSQSNIVERKEYQSAGLIHVHGLLNVIERSSNGILFNQHVCTERCQTNKHEVYSRLRCRKKHEVYSTLICPVRASNDNERLQDISRMSAETLRDNPYLISEFRELVRRVFTVKYGKKLELIKNLHVAMKYHPMDIFYTFTANLR